MREVFKLSGLKKLIVAVSVLFVLNAVTSAGYGSIFSNILGVVTTPLLQMTASASGKVTEYLDLDSLTKEELKEKNRQLSEENAELRSQLLDYDEKVKENEQLKTQLGIKEEKSEVTHVAASVVARSPSDVYYGFSIDKGSLAGIQTGDAVITKEGLVGITTEVYATTSNVKTLFSENIKVAAISSHYEESGVISSSTMLAANGLLRLDYLSNNTQVVPGAIITASGVGGIYPEDLTIGYVTSVEQSEYNVSKYAVIQPYADIKNVTDVFVVTDFPGKKQGAAQNAESETPTDPEAGE